MAEAQIFHAKDPLIEEFLESFRSIMGQDSVRVLGMGHTNFCGNCLYCVVKNCEIFDIYLRTEMTEEHSSFVTQDGVTVDNTVEEQGETLPVLRWDETTKKTEVIDLGSFNRISRIIALHGGRATDINHYKSVARSILDAFDHGDFTDKAVVSPNIENFLSSVKKIAGRTGGNF